MKMEDKRVKLIEFIMNYLYAVAQVEKMKQSGDSESQFCKETDRNRSYQLITTAIDFGKMPPEVVKSAWLAAKQMKISGDVTNLQVRLEELYEIPNSLNDWFKREQIGKSKKPAK